MHAYNTRPLVSHVQLSSKKDNMHTESHKTNADFRLSGQRSQDPPNLLQGQRLQEAHPAQGHPLVINAPICFLRMLRRCRIQGRKGLSVRTG